MDVFYSNLIGSHQRCIWIKPNIIVSYKPAPLVHSSCNVCCTKNHCLGLLVSVKDYFLKKYLGLMLWCSFEGETWRCLWLGGWEIGGRLPAMWSRSGHLTSLIQPLRSCDSVDALSVFFFSSLLVSMFLWGYGVFCMGCCINDKKPKWTRLLRLEGLGPLIFWSMFHFCVLLIFYF